MYYQGRSIGLPSNSDYSDHSPCTSFNFLRILPHVLEVSTFTVSSATIRFSSVGTTQTWALDCCDEIRISCWMAEALRSSSKERPRQDSDWTTLLRIVAPFSPMPPVNTRRSNPPRAT